MPRWLPQMQLTGLPPDQQPVPKACLIRYGRGALAAAVAPFVSFLVSDSFPVSSASVGPTGADSLSSPSPKRMPRRRPKTRQWPPRQELSVARRRALRVAAHRWLLWMVPSPPQPVATSSQGRGQKRQAVAVDRVVRKPAVRRRRGGLSGSILRQQGLLATSNPCGLLQLATSEPCGSKSATACRKASTFCCVYVHAHARTCVCVYACARVCMSVFMFESVLCSPLLTTHTVGSNHQEGIASIDA